MEWQRLVKSSKIVQSSSSSSLSSSWSSAYDSQDYLHGITAAFARRLSVTAAMADSDAARAGNKQYRKAELNLKL